MTADSPTLRQADRRATLLSEQLGRAVMTNLAGLAAILAGAYGASTADSITTALTWLNLSIAGLAVSGVANGLWLLRNRSAFVVSRASLLLEVAALVESRRDAPQPDSATSAPTDADLVWIDGRKRYHLTGCDLVAGRKVSSGGVQRAARGRAPCEVCIH